MPTTILEQVRSLKDLVQPLAEMPEKLLATLEGVKAFPDLLQAGFANIPAVTGTATSTGERDHAMLLDKVKETLARVELFDKNLEKLHSKLMAVAGVVDKLDFKPALEKTELVLRQKLQSVGEDVNLNRGQASSLHKDVVGLDKSQTHLQSLVDGMSQSLAQMGGALSRAPVDSQGQTRALDLLLALGETQKEHGEWLEKTDQSLLEFKNATAEHVQKTQELGITIFELRDRFTERFGRPNTFRDFPTQQIQSSRGPTVIDLQSRIARPSNFATVTFPDGRISMVPEDQLH